MIKRITDEKDFNTVLKSIDIISASQDKQSFYRDILDYITDSEEELTVLIYLLNEDLNQATLVAERNLFSNYLRNFLVIKNKNKILWEVIRKNRIKIHRDLLDNDDVDIEIKSLNKSTAFGVPINLVDNNAIGAIWILSNNEAKGLDDYTNLKNALLEIGRKIASKEEIDTDEKGLH